MTEEEKHRLTNRVLRNGKIITTRKLGLKTLNIPLKSGENAQYAFIPLPYTRA